MVCVGYAGVVGTVEVDFCLWRFVNACNLLSVMRLYYFIFK